MRSKRHSRKSAFVDKIYSLLDAGLPVKPTFNMVIASIAVVFVLFVMACFSASTFASADARLDESKANAARCTAYYTAETTASEILSILSAGNDASITDRNGELKYTENGYDITVSRNGGNFSFDVPINKKESLHVIANVSLGTVDIVQWRIYR